MGRESKSCQEDPLLSGVLEAILAHIRAPGGGQSDTFRVASLHDGGLCKALEETRFLRGKNSQVSFLLPLSRRHICFLVVQRKEILVWGGTRKGSLGSITDVYGPVFSSTSEIFYEICC